MQQQTTYHPITLNRKLAMAIAIAFFVGAIALVVGILLQYNWGVIRFAIGAYCPMLALAGLIIGVGVFIYGLRRKIFNVFEIIYPLTALYMLNYPIRGFFILWFSELTDYVYGFPVNGETYISYALLLFNIGFLAFVVGYFWSGGEKFAEFLPKLSWANRTKGIQGRGLLIYGIGFAAFLSLLWAGTALRFQWTEESRFAVFYNIAAFLTALKVIGLYLIWIAALKKRRYPSVLPFIILVIEIFTGLMIGSKQAIFQVIVAILMAYSYANRPVKLRGFILVGIFLLVFFPLVHTYRAVYRNVFGYYPNPKISEILVLTDDVTTKFATEAEVTTTLEQVMNRANQLDYLTVILYRVPKYVDYQNTLWPNFIAAFVPRLLWPDKPAIALGRYMVTFIMDSSSRANAPLTNVGELYLNFGPMGVPISMFVLGVFYRTVYAYFLTATTSPVIQGMMYLSIFFSMLFLSTGIASFPASIFRSFLLVTMILWLFFRQPAKRNRAIVEIQKISNCKIKY